MGFPSDMDYHAADEQDTPSTDGNSSHPAAEPPGTASLADLLQRQPDPWSPVKTKHIIADILLGLAHAHAAGVSHGNLTASCVLFAQDGTARIHGFASEGDPSADIRAVGLLALRLLSGANLGPTADPQDSSPAPNAEWREWLDRTLAADPSRQWPSAVAALAALTRLGTDLLTDRARDTQGTPRRGLRTLLASLMIVGSVAVAFVWANPRAQQWWDRVHATRAADTLTLQARDAFHQGHLEEAANAAREALQLLPGHPEANHLLAQANTLLARQQQRQQAATAALAAAEQLVATDDIPAALAAFLAIRDNPEHPQAIIQQAARRVLALRSATGTLALPANWPDDARLWIDGQGQVPDNHLVSGIRLGRREITMARDGFRIPRPVMLEFRGLKPLPLPAPGWRPLGGKLSLASNPPGAAVWFRGADTGKRTPCTFEDVGPGKVEYQLKLDGHFPQVLECDVPGAGLLEKSSTLREMPRMPSTDGTTPGERREFDLAAGLRMAFRWCPPGSFRMGGSDPGALPAELPVRDVRLTKGYWLGETEVTQSQWQAVTGQSMAFLKISAYPNATLAGEGPDHPVYFVSWDQIAGNPSGGDGFLGKINSFLKTNGADRWVADLPTEAQWEYACRAGCQTAFTNQGTDATALRNLAWYASNSRNSSHKVGTKDPNPWGLRDMHGNVLEWCRDWFQDNYLKLLNVDPFGPANGWKRVVRGGSHNSPQDLCRSAARGQASTSTASSFVGFRLALRSRDNPPPAAQSPAKQPAKKPATPPARGKTKAKPKPKPKSPPRR